MRLPEHTERHKKAMLEALHKTLGVVTPALKLADVGRATFYGWLKDDESFKIEVDGVLNVALDFAESKLHKLIKDENPTSIIFYLKTKGKHRGYIESQIIIDKEPLVKIEIKEIDNEQDGTN